jgi:hypothetical protein
MSAKMHSLLLVLQFCSSREMQHISGGSGTKSEAQVATVDNGDAYISSSFQHLSIGLSFRAIPALGSFARQFEP